MKHIFTLVLLLLLQVTYVSTFADAQVFNPSVKMGLDISATDEGAISTIEFTGDFVINKHLSIGPGAGIGAAGFFNDPKPKQKMDMVLTIPVFASAKWFFCPDRKVSPFIYGRVGYSFCADDFYDFWLEDYDDCITDYIDNTGLNLAFGPGMDIALKRGSLQVTLNWNMQKVRFNQPQYQPQSTYWTSETLFGLSIGYSWGNRR